MPNQPSLDPADALKKMKPKVFDFDTCMSMISIDYSEEATNIFSDYLKTETDFFTAPASTKYHNSFEGGLVVHSLLTTTLLFKSVENLFSIAQLKYTKGSVILLGLFHDLGKAYKGYYVQKGRGYTYGPAVSYPHAHLSVQMLLPYFNLPPYLCEAILNHNGLFTGTGQEVFVKHKHHILSWLLHAADMTAAALEDQDPHRLLEIK